MNDRTLCLQRPVNISKVLERKFKDRTCQVQDDRTLLCVRSLQRPSLTGWRHVAIGYWPARPVTWTYRGKSCLLIKLTWMEASHWLRRSSHGSLTWHGDLGVRAAPMWGRAVGPRPPATSTCSICLFVTILAKLCYISCIQIILQAQVELGEL